MTEAIQKRYADLSNRLEPMATDSNVCKQEMGTYTHRQVGPIFEPHEDTHIHLSLCWEMGHYTHRKKLIAFLG